MIAIDTNVVVRFLANDDPVQSPQARQLIAQADSIWLATTVLLETEWVLRHTYTQEPMTINQGLLALLGLPNVVAEQPENVAVALHWHQAGLDFADALHLAASHSAQRFVSFDRVLVRRAATVEGAIPTESL